MKRVLSLGQCFADHGSLARLMRDQFRAEVIPVDTPEEALEELRRGSVDLVLVNRILDRTGAAGLEFIRHLKADRDLADTPVMLVSNHEDAQREAVAAGALPGFGKAALWQPGTADRLRAALAAEPTPAGPDETGWSVKSS